MKEQDWPQNTMTTISSALFLDDLEVKKAAVVYVTVSSHMVKIPLISLKLISQAGIS
jgi:hypothetical protein